MARKKLTRDEVYDRKVRKIVDKLIKVCQDRQIPFAVAFELEAPEGGQPAICASVLDTGVRNPVRFNKIVDAIFPKEVSTK